MTKPKLLIVEDDEDIRVQMKWALAGDYEVAMAGEPAGSDGRVHGGTARRDARRTAAAALSTLRSTDANAADGIYARTTRFTLVANWRVVGLAAVDVEALH